MSIAKSVAPYVYDSVKERMKKKLLSNFTVAETMTMKFVQRL